MIRPKLVADGMFLVGIDIVGDKILEVAIERKVAIADEHANSFDNRHLAVL